MRGKGTYLTLVFLASFMLTLFASCKTPDAVQPVGVPAPAPPPLGTGNGYTFAPSDFFVNVVPISGMTQVTHLDGNWSLPCKIQQGSIYQDINCLVEASELDLYAKGLTFSYNFPANMCAYSYFVPYYYYQYLPGLGPTNVTILEQPGLSPVTGPAGAKGPDGVTTMSFSGQNGETPTCSADYSANGGSGPNCCSGTYTITKTVVPQPQPSVVASPTVTVSTGNWGGQPSNCLAGPAVTSQTKDLTGYPTATLTYLNGKNLNANYPVVSPLSKSYFSNLYIANYFTPGPNYDLSSTGAPVAYFPPYTGARAAQPVYEFRCLDHSAEIINRVNVLVRSWSTDSEFASQGNSSLSLPEGIPFNFHDFYNFLTWVGVTPNLLVAYPGFRN